MVARGTLGDHVSLLAHADLSTLAVHAITLVGERKPIAQIRSRIAAAYVHDDNAVRSATAVVAAETAVDEDVVEA